MVIRLSLLHLHVVTNIHFRGIIAAISPVQQSPSNLETSMYPEFSPAFALPCTIQDICDPLQTRPCYFYASDEMIFQMFDLNQTIEVVSGYYDIDRNDEFAIRVCLSPRAVTQLSLGEIQIH
ncbi:hypothetical protein BGZ58_000163 [Dissophora ornata]|nr:hypothetical protein BGZ58_000163 [Dissophora ornata]